MAEIVTALNDIEEVLEGIFMMNVLLGGLLIVVIILKDMKGRK